MDTQITQRYSKVDLLSVKGRMGRRYYLFYSMVPLIFLWAAFSLMVSNHGMNVSSGSLFSFSLITTLVFSILVFLTIQRCHDFDKSGWYAVFVIIPLSNLIYASILSTNGLNRYGEMPVPAPMLIATANYLLIPLLMASIVLSYFL